MAARAGKSDCVESLVGWGADVNEIVVRINERSALDLAEAKRHEIVNFLQQKGAE